MSIDCTQVAVSLSTDDETYFTAGIAGERAATACSEYVKTLKEQIAEVMENKEDIDNWMKRYCLGDDIRGGAVNIVINSERSYRPGKYIIIVIAVILGIIFVIKKFKVTRKYMKGIKCRAGQFFRRVRGKPTDKQIQNLEICYARS